LVQAQYPPMIECGFLRLAAPSTLKAGFAEMWYCVEFTTVFSVPIPKPISFKSIMGSSFSNGLILPPVCFRRFEVFLCASFFRRFPPPPLCRNLIAGPVPCVAPTTDFPTGSMVSPLLLRSCSVAVLCLRRYPLLASSVSRKSFFASRLSTELFCSLKLGCFLRYVFPVPLSPPPPPP